MRLTIPLQLFKLPKGHLFKGKYRLVKRVTKESVETLRKDYQLEEQNMFYLRHPYLTSEQSKGHARVLEKKEKWFKMVANKRNEVFEKRGNRTLLNELSHLKVREGWDFSAGSN